MNYPSSTSTIALGLSSAFHNKQNLTGRKSAFSFSFTPTPVTLQHLADHILSGKAWTPAGFKTQRRVKAAFQSAQCLVLDFDHQISVQDALAQAFIRQYAAIVHPSASSTPQNPRTRVIFILTEPVDQFEAWEALQRGLLAYFSPLRPDTSCKDAARMYFGSDVPGAYQNLEARLPLEIAGGLTQPEADAEIRAIQAARDVPARRATPGSGRAVSAKLVHQVERALDIANKPVGQSGFLIEPIACPIHPHDHDQEAPKAYWHPDKHLLYCHKCGKTYLTRQIAAALQLTRPIQPVDAHILTCSQRYISDYDLASLMQPKGSLLIQSPMGSGKTEGLIRMILARPGGRVLIIVHRKSLARSYVERLNNALGKVGIERRFESYEGLTARQVRQLSHVVICINSLPKLVELGHLIPAYDLVVLDEIEQQLAHLVGDTFKENEAVMTRKVLHAILDRADYVVGMDAYATNLSYRWLQSIRPKDRLYVLVNRYRQHKGQLHVWHDFNQTITHINHVLDTATLPVVIAVNSIRLAKLLYSYYSGETVLSRQDLQTIMTAEHVSVADLLAHQFYHATGLGADAVRVIHGENSHTEASQTLLENMQHRLTNLRVLIYTSAMGSGVDIQTPVQAIFGLFNAHTLPADELHQMLGRCRKTQEYHVCIQGNSPVRVANAEKLYRRELLAAEETGRLFQKRSAVSWAFDDTGRCTLRPEQEAFLRLWSIVQAKINRSLNKLREDFLNLARYEFSLVYCSEPGDEVKEQVLRLRLAQQPIDKHMVLSAPPVDDTTYQRLCDQKLCTPLLTAGWVRGLIERGYRQSITPENYDHWYQGGLPQLRTFMDISAPAAQAIKRDQAEDEAGYALPARHHRAQRRALVLKSLQAVWGDFDHLEALGYVSKKHINTHLGAFLNQHGDQLWQFFKWRPGHSADPIKVLRRILAVIGLKLECLRAGEGRGQYRITPASLATMTRYARAYQAAGEAEPDLSAA